MDVDKKVNEMSEHYIMIPEKLYGIKMTNGDFLSLRCYIRFFIESRPDLRMPSKEAFRLFLLQRFGIDNIDIGTYTPGFVKASKPVGYYRHSLTTKQKCCGCGMGFVGNESFKQYASRHADEWRDETAIPLERFADRGK